MTAGSIEGAGNYVLGSNKLTTGGANLDTEVSGVISGTGGSLVKTGDGIFTLTGQNTYTGGTTIIDGTLNANSTMALGTGSVVVDGTSSVLNTQGTNITNAGTPNQSALTVLDGATVNVQGGSITAINPGGNGIVLGGTQGGPNTVKVSGASVSSAGSAILAKESLNADITLSGQTTVNPGNGILFEGNSTGTTTLTVNTDSTLKGNIQVTIGLANVNLISYKNQEEVIASIKENVVGPAEAKVKELRQRT
jgi:autotransporter-associated beta strand protein